MIRRESNEGRDNDRLPTEGDSRRGQAPAMRRILAALALVLCAAAQCAELFDDAAENDWRRMMIETDRDPAKAAERELRLVAEARARHDEAAELQALAHLSYAREAADTLPSHPDELDRGLALARQLADAHARAWFEMLDAQRLWEKGAYHEAEARYDAALAFAEAQGLRVRQARILEDRGTELELVGRKGEALAWLARAEQAWAALHDRRSQAETEIHIGSVYGGFSSPPERQALAEQALRRALAALASADEPRLLIDANLKLAVARLRQGQPAEACAILQRILPDAQHMRLDRDVLLYLGECEMAQGHDAQALAATEAGIEGLRDRPDDFLLIKAELVEARLLARAAERTRALHALDAARRTLAADDSANRRALFHPLAAQALLALGDAAGAVSELEQARESDRALAREENARLREETRARLDLARQEAENQALRSQQREAQSRRSAMLLAFALVGGALVVSVLWLRRRAADGEREATHQRALAQARQAHADAQAAADPATSDANRS